MIFLKEDGTLDIERIDQLPIEEYMDLMGNLTPTQIKEYISKLQIVASHKPMQAVNVNYNRNDVRSGYDASELLHNLRMSIGNKFDKYSEN